jgi:acyl-CoA synthetase (AMP-forming)/AMP-acid ligase II
METLGDLLPREARTESLAVRAAGDPVVEYTYEDFVTTAWKTANFFRHRGAHEGATVAVTDDAAVPPLLAVFGAAQLGAVVEFGAPRDTDATLVVGPGDSVLAYETGPGATLLAYHDVPDDPAVAAFGRSVWSENPIAPPEEIASDAGVLRTAEGEWSHGRLLAAAAGAAELLALSEDDAVAVRAPLTHPGTVAAGVLAPLSVGASVLFPGDEVGPGDAAVADGDAPEERVVAPGDVV